jgi:hypothetical protein
MILNIAPNKMITVEIETKTSYLKNSILDDLGIAETFKLNILQPK